MAVDLSKPCYDQNTYWGRARHFFRLTNPLNLLASEKQLDESKQIISDYKRNGKLPPGYTEAMLWQQKYLYDSAFHPDTGEKMILIGRMSAQVPMNMVITAGMITFYRSTAGTVFWQWINQSFNAVVNYTNRSGDEPLSNKQLVSSYVAACGGALGTALYLNSRVRHLNPLFARLVPFTAVAAANFINIPMMRSNELINGVPVFAGDDKRVGNSMIAARLGIFLVCVSRVSMAVPSMFLTPMVTNWATKRGWFNKNPMLVLPFQLFMVGFCLTFATPLACALFQQRASLSVDLLDSGLKEKLKRDYPGTQYVYFNKGL